MSIHHNELARSLGWTLKEQPGWPTSYDRAPQIVWYTREGWRSCMCLEGKMCAHITHEGLSAALSFTYPPETIIYYTELEHTLNADNKMLPGSMPIADCNRLVGIALNYSKYLETLLP